MQVLTCSEAHPGLCATVDKWCIEQVKACTKAANTFFDAAAVPTYSHCRVAGEGDYQASSWFQLAHNRMAGLALNMLAMCELDLGSGNVSKSEWDSGFVYLRAVTFFGKLWLATGEANPVNGVYLARAPVDTEHDRSAGDYMRLVADWEPTCLAHVVQVLPPIAHHAQRARASFLTASTLKILSCVQDDHPRRKEARQQSRVVIVGPGTRNAGDPGDAGSNEGSEAGSNADSHSVHSGDDVEQIDVDVDAAVQDRPDQKRPFGPWTLSEIWSNKKTPKAKQ